MVEPIAYNEDVVKALINSFLSNGDETKSGQSRGAQCLYERYGHIGVLFQKAEEPTFMINIHTTCTRDCLTKYISKAASAKKFAIEPLLANRHYSSGTQIDNVAEGGAEGLDNSPPIPGKLPQENTDIVAEGGADGLDNSPPIPAKLPQENKADLLKTNQGWTKKFRTNKKKGKTEDVVQAENKQQVEYTDEDDALFKQVTLELKCHDVEVLKSYTKFLCIAAEQLGVKVQHVQSLASQKNPKRQKINTVKTRQDGWTDSVENTEAAVDGTTQEKIDDTTAIFNKLAGANAEYKPGPKVYERQSLLASVHIYKKIQIAYEARTHFKVIDLMHLTGSTADTYLEYIQRNLPEGVAMKVTKHRIEMFPAHLTSSEAAEQPR